MWKDPVSEDEDRGWTERFVIAKKSQKVLAPLPLCPFVHQHKQRLQIITLKLEIKLRHGEGTIMMMNVRVSILPQV